MIKCSFFLFCILFINAACVSAPEKQKSLFTTKHYSFTVLHNPNDPDSPKLELAMSLLHMNYSEEQNKFLYELLYSGNNPETYKDRIFADQRRRFRNAGMQTESSNWRYEERFTVHNAYEKGIILERELDVFFGGAHGLNTKWYFIIDMENKRRVRVDDFFDDYQSEAVRKIVYSELQKFSGLEIYETLSEGIYFSDKPELTFNFFLTQEGLGLRWDPYSIAPYSAGSIEIILPWRSIRPLMLHSGMELLTNFGIYLFVG